MEQQLLTKIRQHEAYLLNLRDSLERRRINVNNSPTWAFQRAKMIGMLDMLDVLKIDRSEFNWIF